MPLLTDRQEPDDYDRPENPDDPNEYAIRYLFSGGDTKRELQRTGRVLVLAGGGGSLLAFAVLVATLELRVDWLVWLASLLIVGLELLAWRRIWNNPGWVWLAFVPAVFVLAFLLAAFLVKTDGGSPLLSVVYYIPCTLATLLGGIFILISNSPQRHGEHGDNF